MTNKKIPTIEADFKNAGFLHHATVGGAPKDSSKLYKAAVTATNFGICAAAITKTVLFNRNPY